MMSTTVPRSVTVEAYARFRTDGYLVVRGVLAPGEVAELIAHAEALPPVERQRIHMLHRRLEIHERYLLHPRILDVVEGLVGPDVLALQTMLFLKPPGAPGQGYHQDSFHIITKPDTLIGAWIALDRADEENGCLLVTAGSQAEPIYPDADESKGHGGDHRLEGIGAVAHADDPDESVNELTRVAARYRGREVARGSSRATPSSSAATCCTARTPTGRRRAHGARSWPTTATPVRSCRGTTSRSGTGRPATPGTSSPAATPICRTRGRAGLEVRRRAPRARRSGSAGAAARARSSPARPSPGPRAARSSSAGRA
jgi:hypothetical protein